MAKNTLLTPLEPLPDSLLEIILPCDDDDESRDVPLLHYVPDENSKAHAQNHWGKHALKPSGKIRRIIIVGNAKQRRSLQLRAVEQFQLLPIKSA